jgi:hypothetical protein
MVVTIGITDNMIAQRTGDKSLLRIDLGTRCAHPLLERGIKKNRKIMLDS